MQCMGHVGSETNKLQVKNIKKERPNLSITADKILPVIFNGQSSIT